MRYPAVTLLSVLLFPIVVSAWGGDGHQIVCLIAEDRLTPAAKAGIHALLGKDTNISDADIASWADNIRRQRPKTAPYHFVDIPIDASMFDEKRDGYGGNNIIDKISDFEAVLKDARALKPDKVEALKFLVHLVGDVEQPLHCATRKDKGGNGRLVFFLDRPTATNLHTAWDSLILITRKGNERNVAYAERLNAAITSEQAKEWVKGTPTDWAVESHEVAIKNVYRGVPEDGKPPKLKRPYVDAAGIVIDQQLQRGGVRLAKILNDILKP